MIWQIALVVVLMAIAFGLGVLVALIGMREGTGEINYQEDRDRL